MKQILVTGGAGFIGSHLARRLVERGDEVTVVDNLSTGFRDNVPEGASFHLLDLSAPDFVASLPRQPFEAVCHLAGQSSGVVSFEDPVYDIQANSISTLLLSRWCIAQGVGRLAYASSTTVYGNPQHLPVSEDAPYHPLTYYAVSKIASEHYLQLAYRKGLSTVSLRITNAYGPSQNLTNMKQGIASIYLAYLLRGEPVMVKGSFERARDFVFIDDVVDAWVRAIDRPITGSPIYNLGSGVLTTVRELLRQLILAVGEDPNHYPVYEEEPTPGDQDKIYADVSRIKADLGWTPRTSLHDGLRRMVDWARANCDRPANLRVVRQV